MHNIINWKKFDNDGEQAHSGSKMLLKSPFWGSPPKHTQASFTIYLFFLSSCQPLDSLLSKHRSSLTLYC